MFLYLQNIPFISYILYHLCLTHSIPRYLLMKKREKGIVDRGTSCEETEMGEDLGTFRGNHNVRDDCVIGQGAKSLGD